MRKQIKNNYKVVQIWPGLIVCKQVTVCPDHIWTTLYINLQTHKTYFQEICTRISTYSENCSMIPWAAQVNRQCV
jgi:hypothetical protein